MLERIMREVEAEKGAITTTELANRLGVEKGAMEGMLEFLERKGRLSVFRPGGCDSPGAKACAGCVSRKRCDTTGGGG